MSKKSCRRASGFFFLLVMAAVAPAWSSAPRVSPEDLRKAQLLKENSLIILDARAPNDYSASHIQGARSAPFGELGAANLPKDGRVVVYCPDAACSVAQSAADKLTSLGYTNVSVLAGGFADWLMRMVSDFDFYLLAEAY